MTNRNRKRNRFSKRDTVGEGIEKLYARGDALQRNRYGGFARRNNFIIALAEILKKIEDQYEMERD